MEGRAREREHRMKEERNRFLLERERKIQNRQNMATAGIVFLAVLMLYFLFS